MSWPIVACVIAALVAPMLWQNQAAADLHGTSAATANGMPIDPAITAIWEATDGPVASGEEARGWLWGPVATARAVESDPGSPAGVRTMVYYDKARLDVSDPEADPDSVWYASGALLVQEMIAGRMQLGGGREALKPAPEIAVAGDLEQTRPVSYATLGPLASVAGKSLTGAPVAVAESRVGQPIRALLTGSGEVFPELVAESTVFTGAYDAVTGHNIASPFSDWAASQAGDQPAVWLLGRPLTEPYWVDATVAGTPKRVLFQAFERRILTYTPDIPEDWRVESANVGQHYRQWRGLGQPPSDPLTASLASFEPFGEEIVAAASAHGVDPFVLAAVARAVGNDPQAALANGGSGLLGVRPEVAERHGGGDPRDPARNARYAAQELSTLIAVAPQPLDWRAVLASYYAGGPPDWSNPDLNRFVDSTLAAQADLLATHPVDVHALLPVIGDASGALLWSGPAAYYSSGYDVAWWERTLELYASWGQAVPGWQYDPNGFYCVRPGYSVGQRLVLRANGVTISCTIGDTVQAGHVQQWLSRWAIELNWPAFVALGLDRGNWVEVYEYVGE
jgi:hypothetical protein